MFYSQFILAKKGPLGTIWIAAHLERKLRKNQVADTDIGVSVDSILSPDVPIALRLSSHLLVGVVRIYSRKVNYLFDDCSDALLKVRQAFHSTDVDMPPEDLKAPFHSITLPETFDLDDFELPDTETLQGNSVDQHVSSKEQITLEDGMEGVVYSTSLFGPDECFGDGDTAVIDLDLNEELLLDKISYAGDRILLSSGADLHTSAQLSTSQLSEVKIETSGASDYAPANSTIQEMEEPTSPGFQEVQASDDDIVEDHAIITSMAKKESEITRSPLESNGDAVYECANDISSVPDIENVQVDSMLKRDQNDTFHILQLNGECGNVPTVELNGASAVSDFSEKTFDHELDKTSGNGFSTLESESMNFINRSSIHASISSSVRADEEINHIISEKGNITEMIQDLNAFDTEILNHNASANIESDSSPFRRACNLQDLSTDKEVFGISSAVVQEVIDSTMNSNQGPNIAPPQVSNEDANKAYGEVDNLITGDTWKERGRSVAVANLHFPEKLRSLPDVPIGQSNDFHTGWTPGNEAFAEVVQDISMNKISGKKRSFTESTVTAQSLNSVISYEAAQSKRSMEFTPVGFDLLSSILVGRQSTSLKLKPTPPASKLVLSKRPRVGFKSGAYKRKTLMDDSTILHADKIREQLVNTGDIRCVRRKAPSSRPEIRTLQNQFLQDNIFSEPLLTGMSSVLIWLNLQSFSLCKTRILQDDGGSKSQSTLADKTGSPSRITDGEHSVFNAASKPSIIGNGGDEQSLEVLIRSGAIVPLELKDDMMKARLTDGEPAKEKSETLILMDKTETEIDRLESVIAESGHLLTPEAFVSVGGTHERGEHCIDLIVPRDTERGEHCIDLIVPRDTDTGDRGPVELLSQEQLTGRKEADITVDACSVPGPILFVPNENTIAAGSLECGALKPSPGQVLMGSRSDCDGMVYEDETYSDARHDNKSVSIDHPPESLKLDSPTNVEHALGAGNAASVEESTESLKVDSPTNVEHAGNAALVEESTESLKLDSPTNVEHALGLGNAALAEESNDHQNPTDAATLTASDCGALEQYSEFELDAPEHDTGFLNFDDDDNDDYEIAGEGDISLANTEKTVVKDNSGWSTRTRAVANYLQTLFTKEGEHGGRAVHLDNLLVGKTRKEASRLFFETLVLKTRDYVHAEQGQAFGSIRVKPRPKLMTSEF